MVARQESHAGLDLEVIESDRLSRRVLRLRHQGTPLKNLKALQDKAEQALECLSYLEDRLRLVEHDPVRQAVILRSETPETDAEGLAFLEMQFLQDGSTQLQRLRYTRSSGEREPIDMVVTERMLSRLAQDLDHLSESTAE